MILILNEWIFHDLWGENGTHSQREASAFLNSFYSSSDRLVLPSEPRWMRKAYQLMKLTDPTLRRVSRMFFSTLLDSERTIDTRSMENVDIPEELYSNLPEEDIYLVEAYLSVGADRLITTDQGLFDSLADSHLVSCQMRDDFLSSHLS